MIIKEETNILFKDLDEHRRLNIVSEHFDFFQWDGDWVIEDFESELSKEGLFDMKVEWTGFDTQGDGASFTGRVELAEFFEYHRNNFGFEFTRDGGGEWGANLLEELGNTPKFLIRDAIEDGIITCSIDRLSSRYSHHNTVAFIVDREYLPESCEPEIDRFITCLEEYGEEWLERKCIDLYSRLEKAWEAEHKYLYDELMNDTENTYTP